MAAGGDAYAMTWAVGGAYDASPLALGTSIWLAALDPQQSSDRPLPEGTFFAKAHGILGIPKN